MKTMDRKRCVKILDSRMNLDVNNSFVLENTA